MIGDLDGTNFFHDLSLDQLEEITPFCTLLQLNDGDIMIQEGDQGKRDLYHLWSGTVEVVSNDTTIISNEVVLSKEDKELFGEISWLTNGKRTASVRCRGPVEVIRIDGEALMRFLEKNPDIGFLIMRRIAIIISERMEETDNLMKQILWNTGL
jgi:CRP-like cAMP-binding protein